MLLSFALKGDYAFFDRKRLIWNTFSKLLGVWISRKSPDTSSINEDTCEFFSVIVCTLIEASHFLVTLFQ